jgi:hypothetical protein
MGEHVGIAMDDPERPWGDLPSPALKVQSAVATSSSRAVSLEQPRPAGS